MYGGKSKKIKMRGTVRKHSVNTGFRTCTEQAPKEAASEDKGNDVHELASAGYCTDAAASYVTYDKDVSTGGGNLAYY